MATAEQIQEWKDTFGKIFKLVPADGPLAGVELICRPLTREDYIGIMNGTATGQMADPEVETVKVCIISEYDTNVFTEYAGCATVIYDEIMKKSGFTTIQSEEL